MRGAVLYAPGDVRVEERADPTIDQADRRHHPAGRRPASAGRTCGPTAASTRSTGPRPMGHEYVGIVEEVGSDVTHHQARPVRRRLVLRLRQHLRDLPGRLPVPLRARRADGRHRHPGRVRCASRWPTAPWSPPPELPADDLIPSLLAASDVLGTGWFAAVAAEAGPGKTVAVVGDGAVGLLGVLAARQLGAERIIAMSRHADRQKLAREFGATDIVTERGDDGVAADQGPHRRARRALGHRGRRHPGVDDAGHPLHPPRRARRLRRRRPRRGAPRRRAVLLRTSTCTAAPPRCAASCPS